MIVIQNDENANRDSEIAAIFNPKRVRTPSVVVTNESPNNGPSQLANIHQITHSDSVTSSQPDGAESLTGVIISDHLHHQTHALIQSHANQLPRSASTEHEEKAKGCRGSCCSELAQKMYTGIVVTILITFFWVGASHCFYFLFASPKLHESLLKALKLPHLTSMLTSSSLMDTGANLNDTVKQTKSTKLEINQIQFQAPFIASWLSTNFVILFFPSYLLFRGIARKCGANTETFGDILRGLRERGFTFGRYFYRCLSFCLLWVGTTYLYMKSLRVLNATEVIVLFATNVSSVYLLSWVILHEQFVGIRIVAVILVDTGIALLAYKDGIQDSKTLSSVVFATIAGAGYAVFRVMFRKMLGAGEQQPIGSIAFTFTVIGIINLLLLWPICLILYLTGVEIVPWITLLLITLLVGSIFLLLFHILTQFSGAVTYNMFITLGLITSVPVSAALDIVLYGAEFAEMKLGGMILISVGFFLVMLPNNWPEYITRLLRNLILIGHTASRRNFCNRREVIHHTAPR